MSATRNFDKNWYGGDLAFELFDELAGALLVLGGGRRIDLALDRSLGLLLLDRHDDLICETHTGKDARLFREHTSVPAGHHNQQWFNSKVRLKGAAAATKPWSKDRIQIHRKRGFSEHLSERSGMNKVGSRWVFWNFRLELKGVPGAPGRGRDGAVTPPGPRAWGPGLG